MLSQTDLRTFEVSSVGIILQSALTRNLLCVCVCVLQGWLRRCIYLIVMLQRHDDLAASWRTRVTLEVADSLRGRNVELYPHPRVPRC